MRSTYHMQIIYSQLAIRIMAICLSQLYNHYTFRMAYIAIYNVTGTAKINHVSTNYIKLYFSEYL